MAYDVTVTGGAGNRAIDLKYNANDRAYVNALALAASVTGQFQNQAPATYDPLHPPTTTSAQGGYLVVPTSVAGQGPIDARGWQTVTVNNLRVGSYVIGGGNPAQTVLASNGGLTFFADSGNTTVAAGGDNNLISFANGAGSNAAFTGNGNDTIVAGDGNTTVGAGAGRNLVTAGAGQATIYVDGRDTINLGAGSATIEVFAGSALVRGAASVAGAAGLAPDGTRHFSLTFIGGSASSTVLGGAGSYSIAGGAGGGSFTGGSAGGNVITGGSGAVTIFGGGAGDLLSGGAGDDRIYAAGGNETLLGGIGNDTIVAGTGSATMAGGGGANVFEFDAARPGVSDVIADFNATTDKLYLNGYGASGVLWALRSFAVDGHGNGSFSLPDGTKVTLEGVTTLDAKNFA